MTEIRERDMRELQALEEKFDPEMRFRPLVTPASVIVKWLLVILSGFHYYTAGFGLLRETTHRGVHLAFVLGLIFLVFAAFPPGANVRGRGGHDLSLGGVPLVDWPAGPGLCGQCDVHPLCVRRSGVQGGQPGHHGCGLRLHPLRHPAGGHAACHGLASALDRHRFYRLCPGRPRFPGLLEPRRRQLEPR